MKKLMLAAAALGAVLMGCGPSGADIAGAEAELAELLETDSAAGVKRIMDHLHEYGSNGKLQYIRDEWMLDSLALTTVGAKLQTHDRDKIDGYNRILEILKTRGVTQETVSARLKQRARFVAKGQALFKSITASNTEREMSGIVPVLPRAAGNVSGSPEDIAGRTYRSATEYFTALFDLDNYGKEDWSPYLDCNPEFALDDGRSIWSVAVGVENDMDDRVPLLISANFDCTKLIDARNGKADLDAVISIGKCSLINSSCIVVVARNGALNVLPARKVTLRNILNGLAPGALPAAYLAP